MSKLDIKQIAKQIIEAIGGEENIVSAAHCATRLRIVLKDEYCEWIEPHVRNSEPVVAE